MDGSQLGILAPVFVVVAFVYGAVGLGGGSSYLALMALAGVDYRIMPSLALALNLIVAGGGAWHYRRAGHVRWSLFWPLAVTSMPAAWLCGQVVLPRGCGGFGPATRQRWAPRRCHCCWRWGPGLAHWRG